MSPADLELLLFRQGGDPNDPLYGLRLRFRPAGSNADTLYSAAAPLRFDLAGLRARRSGDYAAYGAYLAGQLLAEAGARSFFDQARAVALAQGAALHVRLFLDSSALALHDLLWETLRLPGDDAPLLTGENVRFSRYLSARHAGVVDTPSAADVRALVAVAAPRDTARYRLAEVRVLDELRAARAGLGDIPADELAAPQPVTLNRLLDRLRDGYGLLYLVAHGILVDGEPQILLEDEDGAGRWVSGVDLAARLAELRDQQRPRLVVLVSCQSAGSGEAEPAGHDGGALAGLGPRLAAAGVPAVIAMQGNVTMATAAAFMPAFLRELRRDGQVDRAMAVARGAVRERPDWWMPVLFTRLSDGRVWTPPHPDALSSLPRQPFEPETVYIPAGSFLMGRPVGDGVPDYETPLHPVTLPGYRMGKYPVTNREYAAFLAEQKDQPAPQGWFNRTPPAGKPDHPVTHVNWRDAMAYCAWLSVRTGRRYTLPSEAEWERAGGGREVDKETSRQVDKGDEGRYPWGDEWVDGRCNAAGQDTSAVTAYPAGASGYGVHDLLGNVQEWTRSLWGLRPAQPDFGYPYDPADGRELLDPARLPAQARLVQRGGSFKSQPAELRCTARGNALPDSRIGWRGFRVAMILSK